MCSVFFYFKLIKCGMLYAYYINRRSLKTDKKHQCVWTRRPAIGKSDYSSGTIPHVLLRKFIMQKTVHTPNCNLYRMGTIIRCSYYCIYFFHNVILRLWRAMAVFARALYTIIWTLKVEFNEIQIICFNRNSL